MIRLSKKLLFPLLLNLFLALFGFILLISGIYITEASGIVYLGLTSAIALMTSWLVDNKFSNWTLWFFGFYFLLYPFGSLFGLMLIGPTESFLDFPTTFAQGFMESSRCTSYIVTGFAASVLAVFVAVLPPSKKMILPRHDNLLELTGMVLFLISLPMILIHYIFIFKTYSLIHYSALYSAEAREIISPVPFISLWTNLNKAGFLFFLSSMPSRNKFFWLSLIFLMIMFCAALYGGRIHFLVPLAMILWYRSHYYPSESLRISRVLILFCLVFSFAFAMQSYRSNVLVELDGIIRFMIYSVSAAQYHVAAFIENIHLLDQSGPPFWLAPVIFPLYYLKYGSDIVGQGLSSATLRPDLSHIISSTLNLDAYVNGAGMGSSLVAEAFQYGPVLMIFILALFYLFYRWFFNNMTKNRFLFFLSPMIFSHVIFSPRDSLFPNTWVILKITLIFIFYFLFSKFLSKISHRSKNSIGARQTIWMEKTKHTVEEVKTK